MPTLVGVRALRERLALKQAELAERAGVHRITLIRAERGHSMRVDVVAKIAAALRVPPARLVAPKAEARPAPTPRLGWVALAATRAKARALSGAVRRERRRSRRSLARDRSERRAAPSRRGRLADGS
jgi:transcriptional regulator with XRE-family HTH domain